MKDVLNHINYIMEVCISLYECNCMISRNEELEENLLKFCDNSDDDIVNKNKYINKLYPILEDVAS